MTPERDVLLVFSSQEARAGPTTRSVPGFGGGMTDEIAVRVQEVAGWFKEFDIDQIVVSISGCVSTGSALKLIINAQGTGGVTLTLKPKPKPGSPPAPSTS